MNIPQPRIKLLITELHAIRITTIILLCMIHITSSAQIFDNETKLQTQKVFDFIEIGIPEGLKSTIKNKRKGDEMGFANYENADKSIEIEFRRMPEADLSLMQSIMDRFSQPKLKWKVLKNELKQVNRISVLVTDVEGQTYERSQVTGIFIYNFNSKGSTYRLWMQYPLDAIEKTEQVRSRMIEAIRIID